MRYSDGTSKRMIAVENRMPAPSEIAIGMMYWAWSDDSNTIGANPPKVVSVVSTIGRKRRKPAWWMAKQLAEKLGLGRYFPWPDYTFVIDWQLKQVGSSLQEMQRIGIKRFTRKTRPYFADGEAVRFNTPSGRIELWSSLLADTGQDPLPRYTPPDRPPLGFYHLNYGRAPAHTFGRTINNPQLFELMPENVIWVHPSAAALHGVASGDYVRLENPEGRRSNRVRVRVTERIRPDSIFIVHGFGHSDERQRLARGVGADDAALMHNVKIDPIAGSTGMRASFVTLIKSDRAS